ncbi:MAG: protein translocase subunit SecD [Planctomycetes bacterium]|nr:protein translocase subunit SecD [Planctomycetota bacterium]
MQRNFLRGLLICLIPCLLAALFAVRPEKYRLGIDLAGGTILVYQVNLERTKLRKETEQGKDKDPTKDQNAPAQGLTSDEMAQLAAQIKRRIDPTDIKNVTVRPSGDRRVEIILPTSGAAGGRANLSTEDIEEVKRLISQMGVLEFRILANGPDDEKGMLAARDAITEASKKTTTWVNPKTGKEEPASDLQVRAARGLPPTPPDGTFEVDIGDTKAKVRYVWVEIGQEYREEHGLSNASEGTGGLWGRLAANRDKTVAVPNDDISTASSLYYSRECVSADQLAKEKADFERLKRENPTKSDAEIEALMNRKKYEYFVLTRVSPVDSVKVGGDITLTANSGTDPKTFNPCVEFVFNAAGGQVFGQITRRNKPDKNGHTRLLAVVLDERLVSAATIQSEITTRGQITGKFDRKKVDRDVQILRSGALSAELVEKPVSENTIGPTLGADTIKRGTTAIGMAFVAVLVFMVVYYRFAGFVACVALFANLLLTIGFMVAVNAAFTLPGLAGLVLTLGMAVDANVLIYERLREERNKGANLATAIRNGYDRAFFTIIDTHLTSIFTAIVLYVFGNDQLKGFAISLTVGLIISLFTSLYMTRLMFDFWLYKKWLTELKMMRLFERPSFNPMKYRWFFFPLTGALTILGLFLFLHRGEEVLNVDFRGGTVFAGRLKDGEERGLTKTDDGKLGFRELLGEGAQKSNLAVKDVFWENKPTGDTPVNTWVYTITYADGEKTTVTLTEKPGGPNASPEQMEADVKERASALPDVSVEQMFLSGEDYPMGKSKRFTIRTTEKQRALVQASLDRLLRDEKGKTLLDAATMTPGPVTGAVVNITFDKPTSLAFTTELFAREFKKTLAADTGPDTFTLTGVGEPVDGRYTQMRLDVSRNPTLALLRDAGAANNPARADQLKALQSVVASTKQAFDSTPEPERLEVFDSQLAKETRKKASLAIAASWIAILLYLWFRFGNWTFGLAAVICLVHDLCFTLGAIAVCHYLHLIPGLSVLKIEDFKIDLAAVAALLTLVGYSVNEIIVNFARIREVRGKNPQLTPQMINDSVNQTLSRTILTSMTVLLVSVVLYVFGGEGVHLFSFVMVVGVLVSTYSSIFVASPLLLFLGEGHAAAGAATETPAETETEESSEQEVVEG